MPERRENVSSDLLKKRATARTVSKCSTATPSQLVAIGAGIGLKYTYSRNKAAHISYHIIAPVDMHPVIQLENLSVRHGGRQILNGLAGTLSGRTIGLFGPNGAGKSTLINTLLG
jgi:ABC-type molybdenum transport system ATPase subunit/photorepair protein PhrA